MWRSVAIGVVLAGLLAGCSFGSGQTTRYGEVKGIVGVTGGKADFAAIPFAHVVARREEGNGSAKQVAARTMADRFGHFKMRLPVGTYRLAVVFENAGTARVEAPATIHDSRVTRVKLIESII